MVWPFVEANIESENWHYKEAAIMVFGCLLHNEEPKFMEPMVSQACPMLITNVLNDPCIAVRDSSAWVLAQICTYYLPYIPGELSTALIECLISALDMEPRVAQHAAMGISSIADAISQPPNSAILQPYYNALLQKLTDCAEKTGAANNQLRENAANGLISLIGCVVEGTEDTIIAFGNWIIQKCNQWLVGAVTAGEG